MAQTYGHISLLTYKSLSVFEPDIYYNLSILPIELQIELIDSNYIIPVTTLFGKQFILNTRNGKGFCNTIHHYTS
jgi:hypothetical protein